jgi:hypothetical protein
MPIHDATHPHYDDHKSDWQTTRRMVSGEDVSEELVRRYFEHADHYDQRQKDADFTPRSRFLLSRIAGILHQRAADVDRDLGPVSEEDLEAAGPAGEDYSVLMLQLTETLLTYDEAAVVLNPASGLHVKSPLALPHWGEDAEGPFAVVASSRVTTDGPFSDSNREDTYVLYRPAGYETYVEDEATAGADDNQRLVDRGAWAEDTPFFVDADGRPTTPVLRLSMPWEARVGLQIARKHRAMYRMGSRRDFALSSAMNGLIQFAVGDNADLSDDIESNLRGGYKWVPYSTEYGEHKGLQMPTNGAQLGTEVLEKKKEELNRVAYNELEKGARSSTSATEAQIKHQGAAAAALSVLAAAMSDAETRILRLMAQAQDFRAFAGPSPSDPGVSAEWPSDYSDVLSPRDDDLAGRIFGATLPADEETATEVALDAYEEEGFSPEEEALREAVRQKMDRGAQATSQAREFL